MFQIDRLIEAGGYFLTAIGFVFLAVLLVSSYRGRLRGVFLASASLATAIWSSLYVGSLFGLKLTGFTVFLMEFFVDVVWLVFLASLMGLGIGGSHFSVLRVLGIVVSLGSLCVGLILQIAFEAGFLNFGAERILIFGQIVVSLIVLINVEQIVRNSRDQQRQGLKYLCLGIGAIYAFDLILYSHAVLVEGISAALWSARGYVSATTVPLLAIAVNRMPTWSGGLFVSRYVVFHTATVFAAGAYLILIGLTGQYIREFGGSWGTIAQTVFIAVAILGLCALLISERIRSQLRVFINKHFYRNKYDYRQEWLRLTETMTSLDDSLPLRKRAIKALANILGSRSGSLWLRSARESSFYSAASWNRENPNIFIASDASLPNFLRSTGWIIDLLEYQDDPVRYANLNILDDPAFPSGARFVVPLMSNVDLIGFAVLAELPNTSSLNYEDRDMLKTAGRQIASYLSQDAAMELLAQSRQFEAFNRLTAFLMHDLKNVMAQQSLIIENASKHKHKPEFIDDVIKTLDGGVSRMRRVIEQLRQSSAHSKRTRVDLVGVAHDAVNQCSNRRPRPTLKVDADHAWIHGDKDRIYMAMCHAIRNAQDASEEDGAIQVDVQGAEGGFVIQIQDRGIGMDEAFIRERLFRPFDSTKGTQGMGIGAFQLRETVLESGGRVDVVSKVGRGTTITIFMPAAS